MLVCSVYIKIVVLILLRLNIMIVPNSMPPQCHTYIRRRPQYSKKSATVSHGQCHCGHFPLRVVHHRYIYVFRTGEYIHASKFVLFFSTCRLFVKWTVGLLPTKNQPSNDLLLEVAIRNKITPNM